jgi:hypothetical protein
MKWFRSQIKLGSRLALFALAIQFALSFGHSHGIATAQAATAIQSSVVAPDAADRQPTSNHDSDQHPNDGCAICAVIALANAMLSATPPLLLLPQAAEFFYRATDAEFVDLNPARVVFQPRAPPIS